MSTPSLLTLLSIALARAFLCPPGSKRPYATRASQRSERGLALVTSLLVPGPRQTSPRLTRWIVQYVFVVTYLLDSNLSVCCRFLTFRKLGSGFSRFILEKLSSKKKTKQNMTLGKYWGNFNPLVRVEFGWGEIQILSVK